MRRNLRFVPGGGGLLRPVGDCRIVFFHYTRCGEKKIEVEKINLHKPSLTDLCRLRMMRKKDVFSGKNGAFSAERRGRGRGVGGAAAGRQSGGGCGVSRSPDGACEAGSGQPRRRHGRASKTPPKRSSSGAPPSGRMPALHCPENESVKSNGTNPLQGFGLRQSPAKRKATANEPSANQQRKARANRVRGKAAHPHAADGGRRLSCGAFAAAVSTVGLPYGVSRRIV